MSGNSPFQKGRLADGPTFADMRFLLIQTVTISKKLQAHTALSETLPNRYKNSSSPHDEKHTGISRMDTPHSAEEIRNKRKNATRIERERNEAQTNGRIFPPSLRHRRKTGPWRLPKGLLCPMTEHVVQRIFPHGNRTLLAEYVAEGTLPHEN